MTSPYLNKPIRTLEQALIEGLGDEIITTFGKRGWVAYRAAKTPTRKDGRPDQRFKPRVTGGQVHVNIDGRIRTYSARGVLDHEYAA